MKTYILRNPKTVDARKRPPGSLTHARCGRGWPPRKFLTTAREPHSEIVSSTGEERDCPRRSSSIQGRSIAEQAHFFVQPQK